jgi:hypothetical protein
MSAGTEMMLEALKDASCGWSVGTFGAVGEFAREPGEECAFLSLPHCTELVTARGGIRVSPRKDVTVIAYETFLGDGETWGNAVSFCLPRDQDTAKRTIRCLGPDEDALRAEDRNATLFDLGVGVGHVTMCVRTDDPELTAALDKAAGEELLNSSAGVCVGLIRRLSPARVLLSPLARLEVCASIPPAGGKSPAGPHTHLLPKLLASRRTHSANAPIPEELQPVLVMHPRSPWRDAAGQRTPYDAERARAFDLILNRFGLEEDRRLRVEVETAVRRKVLPVEFPKPPTRHGRIQLRIVLRRLAQDLGPAVVGSWREVYDGQELDEPDLAVPPS